MKSKRWLARPMNLSEGGIHSDETARSMGFAGGFVPGVALYSLVVAELLSQGLDWLRTGTVEYRFRRPVYDGEEVLFTVDADLSTFTITTPDDGDLRSSGRLGIVDQPPTITHARPVAAEREPLGKPRQIGIPLQIEVRTDEQHAADAMAASGNFSWYENGRALLPVSLWLNPIALLRSHYDSPVTIHSAGRVWHHSPVYMGETVIKRGHITGFEERMGNQIVSFAVAMETGDGRPVATVEHQSVYALARAGETRR